MSDESGYGGDWEKIYRSLKQMIENEKKLREVIQSSVAPMMSVIEKEKKLSKAMSEAMSPAIKQIQQHQARLIEAMRPFIDWYKKMGEGE